MPWPASKASACVRAGGANEAAMELISQFKVDDDIEGGMRKKLANKELIMGFGHRIYKVWPPGRPGWCDARLTVVRRNATLAATSSRRARRSCRKRKVAGQTCTPSRSASKRSGLAQARPWAQVSRAHMVSVDAGGEEDPA